MKQRLFGSSLLAGAVLLASVFAVDATASTIAQNSHFNVTRPGSTEALRIVAYGDSIYAGFLSPFSIARRAGPHVGAEYAAALWGQNIEVRRRAQAGAIAAEIYSRMISATDSAFMTAANTRIVTFEMCGNDYLGARSAFAGQTGQCSFTGLEAALAACKDFTERAIQHVDNTAHPNVKLKIVGNLYYPGFNADNVQTRCTDPESGETFNRRDRFLPLLAESNWETCNLADQYGWECADNFAEFMAADDDTNGDGLIDSEAIRYRSGEPLEAYRQRITVDLADTLSDSNFKEGADGSTFGYLISDDTHPTHQGRRAFALGTPGGNVPLLFPTGGAYPESKNPVWNRNGHDRMGYELAKLYDLQVSAGEEATLFACETYASTATFNDRVFFGPWYARVDYGDDNLAEASLEEMALPLSNRYTAPGSYELSVLIEGAYSTLWNDTTTVEVLDTAETLRGLIRDLDALLGRSDVRPAWVLAPKQFLIRALTQYEIGQVTQAQIALDGFLNLMARGPLPASSRETFFALGERLYDAVACTPAVTASKDSRGISKPLPRRQPIMQDYPEELWQEVDGIRYSMDDPALAEAIEAQPDI